MSCGHPGLPTHKLDVTHQSNINSINQELMTHEIAAVIWRSYMRPWILSCLSLNYFESMVQNVMNSFEESAMESVVERFVLYITILDD